MSDIRFNGKMVSFTRLILNTDEPPRILQSLQAALGTDTGAHQGTLIVLDSSVPQDLAAVLALLQSYGLKVMAVVKGMLSEQGQALGLAILPADQPMQRIQPTEQVVPEVVAPVPQPVQVPPYQVPTYGQPGFLLVHNDTLRTGQQLLSERGDLLLFADMNSGSELISMGHAYIYGSARGRIIAGAAGHKEARIFCQRLEAELVSVAGTYCVADDIPTHMLGQSVQISLNENGTLIFRQLNNAHEMSPQNIA